MLLRVEGARFSDAPERRRYGRVADRSCDRLPTDFSGRFVGNAAAVGLAIRLARRTRIFFAPDALDSLLRVAELIDLDRNEFVGSSLILSIATVFKESRYETHCVYCLDVRPAVADHGRRVRSSTRGAQGRRFGLRLHGMPLPPMQRRVLLLRRLQVRQLRLRESESGPGRSRDSGQGRLLLGPEVLRTSGNLRQERSAKVDRSAAMNT